MRAAAAAFEFLTILRFRAPSAPVTDRDLAASVFFYPLVGLSLGCILAAADWALRDAVPVPVCSALLVAILAVLTGGLHLDGLSDTFDGLGGGRDRDSRLRIMRDTATGSFGMAAVALVLLIDGFALASVPAGPTRTGVLLVTPLIARSAMVCCIATVPYPREQGLGRLVRRHSRPAGASAVGLTAGVLALLFGAGGLGIIAVVAAPVAGLAAWSWRAIGGMTGDGYGAACEIATAAVLVTASSGVETGWLTPSGILTP